MGFCGAVQAILRAVSVKAFDVEVKEADNLFPPGPYASLIFISIQGIE